METDIKKLSVEQLKALAYDFLVQREVISRNIEVINLELRQRDGEKTAEKNFKTNK